MLFETSAAAVTPEYMQLSSVHILIIISIDHELTVLVVINSCLYQNNPSSATLSFRYNAVATILQTKLIVKF